MKKWKLSAFTRAVADEGEGGVLLHNSFMGAVARVPPGLASELANVLAPGFDKNREPATQVFDEPDASQPGLRDLCRSGFFVPADLDEREAVMDVIRREREAGFGMIILPHENCNFRCTYCYETFERGKMKRDIIDGLKIFGAKKAKEVGCLSASWFGGEPLLAREVIYELSESFLASCEAAGGHYQSSITTNGYFLTPEVLSRLLDYRVRLYQITLDGPEAVHDTVRKLAGGGGTYQRIVANLEAMHESDADFTVRVRVNFSPATVPSMDEFLAELSEKLGGDPRFSLDFHPVGLWGGPNDSVMEVCDADSAETIKVALMEKSLHGGFSETALRENLMPHGSICYAGKESSIVVGSDGTIYKCTVAFQDPRNHVGRLTKEGELLVNPALWDLWTKMDGKDDAKCGTCSFSPACQSRACPLVAIHQEEPPCPVSPGGFESMVRLVGTLERAERVVVAT
jgi:uncharacterized protein